MPEKKKDVKYLIFASDNGRKVLEDLTRHFAPRYHKDDPVKTHVSVAQGEVIKYINNELNMAINNSKE